MGDIFKRALQTAQSKGYSGLFSVVILGFEFIFSYYLHFIAQYLMPVPSVSIFLHKLRGVKIGKGVILSPYSVLDIVYPRLLTIEDHVTIAPGAKIFCHSKSSKLLLERGFQKEVVDTVTIKENSVIGSGAVILPGVTIGPASIIMPNSVVYKDVKAYSVAGGIPARVMKHFLSQADLNMSRE